MAPTKKVQTRRVRDDQARSKRQLNRRIRAILLIQKVTHEEVARVISVNPATISRGLVGQRSWKGEELAEMAKFFGSKPTIWFDEDDVFAQELARLRGD